MLARFYTVTGSPGTAKSAGPLPATPRLDSCPAAAGLYRFGLIPGRTEL